MRFIAAIISLFYFLPGHGTSNDTILSKKHGENIYHQEAAYYLNHLDSFVIRSYYGKLIQTRPESAADSTAHIMLDDRTDKYEAGLKQLDANSPFDFRYNNYVAAFIDLYVYKKRGLTENCLGLSEYYFPIFEEMLDKYDLPIEFKYLAVVESALNVNAKSRAGAAGLWQFMYRTGKYYGLKIDSYVDERYEIYAATDAACRYFRDMYAIYGNWELVIAAYNCGPGNVNKAIRKSGGKKDYWEIRSFLPRETRGYVPAFIAVNYAMNFGNEHGLVAAYPDSLNLLTDTIKVSGPLKIHDLAAYFCGNEYQLKYLNPSYKLGVIPGDGKKHPLRMPIGLMNAYLIYHEAFDSYLAAREAIIESTEKEVVMATAPSRSGVENIHVVKSGEVLGIIAEKYGCSVGQIKDWNNLYTSRINEGQKLVLYLDKKVVSQPVAKAQPELNNSAEDNPNYKYHVIKPGDTLWDIAQKYDGLTVTELKRLNSGLNYKKLKPGDKIVVSTKS
jgi:membrane-bound lytic murein transglycosylase D